MKSHALAQIVIKHTRTCCYRKMCYHPEMYHITPPSFRFVLISEFVYYKFHSQLALRAAANLQPHVVIMTFPYCGYIPSAPLLQLQVSHHITHRRPEELGPLKSRVASLIKSNSPSNGTFLYAFTPTGSGHYLIVPPHCGTGLSMLSSLTSVVK